MLRNAPMRRDFPEVLPPSAAPPFGSTASLASSARTRLAVRGLRVLTKDSPENRGFFGEGIKVVVEVVVDPQRQIDHSDDLWRLPLCGGGTALESGGCC